MTQSSVKMKCHCTKIYTRPPLTGIYMCSQLPWNDPFVSNLTIFLSIWRGHWPVSDCQLSCRPASADCLAWHRSYNCLCHMVSQRTSAVRVNANRPPQLDATSGKYNSAVFVVKPIVEFKPDSILLDDTLQRGCTKQGERATHKRSPDDPGDWITTMGHCVGSSSATMPSLHPEHLSFVRSTASPFERRRRHDGDMTATARSSARRLGGYANVVTLTVTVILNGDAWVRTKRQGVAWQLSSSVTRENYRSSEGRTCLTRNPLLYLPARDRSLRRYDRQIVQKRFTSIDCYPYTGHCVA